MRCPECQTRARKVGEIKVESLRRENRFRLQPFYRCDECETEFVVINHQNHIISEGTVPADLMLQPRDSFAPSAWFDD